MIRSNVIHEPLALWASRLSLFALALVVLCLLLHRLGVLGTQVAITSVVVAYISAGLGILIGLVAWVSIWVRGRAGAGRTAIGLIIGGMLWGGAAAALPTYSSLPPINDITTDIANPPRFAALAKERPPGAKSPNYPGDRTARQQTQYYPDLRTLVIDRSAEEVFEYARLTAFGRKGLGWKMVTMEPPAGPARPGMPPRPGIIEATSRTTIVGFTDDIIIRISGTDNEARVDIRSASRFGRHDFGTNASRVRRFIRELQARLDASTPGSIVAARAAANRAQGIKTPVPVTGKRPAERPTDPKSKGKDAAPSAKDTPKGAKAQPKG